MDATITTDIKVFLVLLFDLIAIFQTISTRKILYTRKTNIIFLLFFIILIHSLLFSDEMDSSIYYSLKAIFVISSIILVSSIFEVHKIFFYYKKFLQISSTLIIFFSIVLYFTQAPTAFRNGNFQSFLSNPNQLSLYISVLFIPYYINQLFIIKSKSKVDLLLFISLLIILVLTGSRTGAFVVTIIFLFLLIKNYRKINVKYFSIFFLLIMMLLFYFTQVEKFIYKGNENNILSTRTMLFENRLKGIDARPLLGWGYHVNKFHFVDEYHDFPKFEKGNTYLAIVEEFGFFIGFLIIILLFKFYYDSITLGENYYYLSLFILASLVHSNAETWIFIMHGNSSLLFWFSVILMYRIKSENEK